jgi:hypothetical protein
LFCANAAGARRKRCANAQHFLKKIKLFLLKKYHAIDVINNELLFCANAAGARRKRCANAQHFFNKQTHTFLYAILNNYYDYMFFLA